MSETPGDLIRLSPAEPADGGTFDIVRRGYDRAQVEDAFAQLHDHQARLEAAVTAERAARAHTESDAAALRAELAEAQRAAVPQEPTFEALGERVGSILALARDEAAALLAAAEAAVAPGRQAAQDDAARLRAESEATAERTVTQANAEAERLLATARDEAATVRAAAQEEAERLLADGRQQQAEAALAAKSTVAEAHQESEEALAAASREAGTFRRTAREEVERLGAQRDAVRAEIARLRDALANAVGMPAPVHDDEAGGDALGPAAPVTPGPEPRLEPGSPAAPAG